MHRVIIPVDFSETSLNAARYAAQMLSGKKDAVAIIYHNYEHHDDHDVSLHYQESLRQEFLKAGVNTVECEGETGGDLIDNITRLAHTIRATLIVMGITGKSTIRQIMFGSNTLKLIDRNLYPVMIIPPDAKYKGFNNVAFASDFKNVKDTTPAELISSVLEMFDPKLHIFTVNKHLHVSIPDEMEYQKKLLKEMFNKYKTEFYFITRGDFYTAVDNFITDYNIDVLITVPKHQSNSTSLFKTTHTKRLAYHSHIPILAAHE
ncbi:MAG TPA: universal stress protein [Chitinophagaceae bacterium]|nr:universal stress protein [Chitinophagaceae bacterium]MCB0741949.1 universal stress protein [Chitinophagaceae bacterium]HQV07468.1 universal stress protein [Chitinophagaceae bacterium]